MKRYNLLWALLAVVCVQHQMCGQTVDWFTGGNTGLLPGTSFLGTTDGVPINFRTNNLLRARLYPNQTSNFSATYPAVPQNGFFALSGQPNFFTQAASPGAFSRLHLVDQAGNGTTPVFYAPTQAYRGWMRNGITMTGNADMGYLGQKYNGNDRTDMVLHWSNDAGTMAFAPDHLRIMFSTLQDGAASGATSFEGLEAARFYPPRTTEVFMGLGDFFAGNLVDPVNITEPTERLDVLNGRVRIRQLPDDDTTEDAYKVMVVDDTADPLERGVVKWVDPAVFEAANCDWTKLNDGTSGPAVAHHLYTAVGTSNDCPDNSDAVGVGVDLSSGVIISKLNVRTDNFVNGLNVGQISGTTSGNGINVLVNGPTTTSRGLNITAQQGATASADNRGVSVTAIGTGSTTSDFNFGVFADAQGPARWSRGVHGESNGAVYYGLGGEFVSNDNASYTTGAQGHVTGGQMSADGILGTCISNATINSGVHGSVSTPSPSGANKRYFGVYGITTVTPAATQLACGVYGEAINANSWAVYSSGRQASTTSTLWTIPSDASLKTQIEPLTGALERLLLLKPKQYHYRTEEFPHMHLATGLQYGVLAQELEEVFPTMVGSGTTPAEVDSSGAEVHPAVSYKTVDLSGILPMLVAALQEQQEMIDAQKVASQAQQERLDHLEDQLAACCANPGGNNLMQQPTGAIPTDGALDTTSDRKLRIVPNPFSEPPTVFYTLDRAGRMQLIANSADGKELNVLQEATMPAGDYQYAWDTTNLAPGMYYVTLLMDGKPLVKKAVKVTR